jgi:plastocyanin
MKNILIGIVVVVLVAAGYFAYKQSYKTPSQPSGGSTAVSTNSVDISNFSFNPPSITVKANSDIIFSNKDNVTHTVTADNGKFNQELASGATATITIADPGTYTYHCSVHPSMKGTITVQ